MLTGVINRPLHSKGYGFITPDDGSKDVFVHVNELKEGTEQDLVPGTRVSYELRDSRQGPKAISVRIISEPDFGPDYGVPDEQPADIDWYKMFTEMAGQARELTEKLERAAEAVRPV